jgi:disulfide bond formation protein DsbB
MLTATPTANSHTRERVAVAVSTLITLVAVVLWVVSLTAGIKYSAWRTPAGYDEAGASAAGSTPNARLDATTVARGKHTYALSCLTCHGPDARGVVGMGKDLVTGVFARSLTEAQLVEFVKRGRAATDPLNTTKVAMPPKGGLDRLTDADLGEVIGYLRSLQDPTRTSASEVALAYDKILEQEAKVDAERAAARAAKKAELAATKAAQPSSDGAIPGGAEDEYDAETIEYGGELFVSTCSACHGADGKGLPNNGRDLVTSAFIRELDDEKLLAFIKRGRDPGDPLSTTKILMPPKGGNPALNDEKMEAIIAYLREIQKPKPSAPK